MDPKQSIASSSIPEETITMEKIEQLFRLISPNLDITQAMAALAPPPQSTATQEQAQQPETDQASTHVIQEEEAYSGPTEVLEDEGAGAEIADDAESGPHKGEGGAERAGVAPESLQETMELTDAEGVEMVRTKMASEDVERATDAERIEEVMMAEMGAEIRIDTGEIEASAGREIFAISDSEEEGN